MIWLFREWLGGDGDMYPPTTPLSTQTLIASHGEKNRRISSLREGEKVIPGFEAVFVIAGLLAVAYILRRRK